MNIVLLITFVVFILSYLIKRDVWNDRMCYVKSNINGKEYRVRKLEDKQEACDLLASTHEKMLNFCKHLYEKYPDDKRVVKVMKRFPNTVLCESDGYGSQTSYSINKGEKIVLCMRMKDGTNSLVDDNLLLFVALHELSHIMTKSVGHKQEFWDNFKFVLKEAQDNGYYKCIDFSSRPQKYCGIEVTSSPQQC